MLGGSERMKWFGTHEFDGLDLMRQFEFTRWFMSYEMIRGLRDTVLQDVLDSFRFTQRVWAYLYRLI